MLYIEQIPRTEDAPFYTTDLSDIPQIRNWIMQNCDITKRHVISESRRGKIIAEGISLELYYGWQYKEPMRFHAARVVKNHMGYKTFTNKEDAIVHYFECKRIAEIQLAIDAELAENSLEGLRKMGINFSEWATAADDYNLESGLCVSVEIEGFYFKKNIN